MRADIVYKSFVPVAEHSVAATKNFCRIAIAAQWIAGTILAANDIRKDALSVEATIRCAEVSVITCDTEAGIR